jgi:16S rRNA (uracil1498-N3)-methyltransferase
MPSYYCPDLNSSSTLIHIEGEEFHHLSHVKRIATGQTVKLNSGKGLLAVGTIVEIGKRSAEIEIQDLAYHEQPSPRYAIAFALLKNHHDELLIEKCTELGATAFYPLVTEFSVKSPSANTISRYEKIALAAIKQCDNPWLPQIMPAAKLEQAINSIIQGGYTPVLCSELRPDAGVDSLDKQINPCFLIGPEGGFSNSEFQQMLSLNIPTISICKLITRAETAAIAVSAQFTAIIN